MSIRRKNPRPTLPFANALESRWFLSVSTTNWVGPTDVGTQWQYAVTDKAGLSSAAVATVIGPNVFDGAAATEIDTVTTPLDAQTPTSTTMEKFVGTTSDGEVEFGTLTPPPPNAGLVAASTVDYSPAAIQIPATMTAGLAVNYIDAPVVFTGLLTMREPAIFRSVTLESETPQSVTVPDGTFSCFAIDTATSTTDSGGNTTTTSNTYFYSPGVGLIKQTGTDGDWELTSFSGTISTAERPDHLVIANQPMTVQPGVSFSSALSVDVVDAGGNIVTGDNSAVTIGINSQLGAGNLNGTLTVNASDGIATFSDVSLNDAGIFTIIASDASLTKATTQPIQAENTSAILAPAVVTGTLANSVVAGSKPSGTIGLQLNNSSASAQKTRATVTVFATSPAGEIIPLANIKSKLDIAPSASIVLKLPVKHLSLPAGSYTLGAVVNTTSGQAVASAVGTSLSVAVATVDLSGKTTASAKAVMPGHPTSVSVEIYNSGNSSANGTVPITIGTTQLSQGESPSPIETVNLHLHIAAGGHMVFHIPVKIPIGIEPGDYHVVTQIDPTNVLNESNTTNNVAYSPNLLTVSNAYPGVIGTFSGSFTITRGPDRTKRVPLNLDITSEDQTSGAIAFAISDSISGSDQYGTGTVSANGTVIGSDSPLLDIWFKGRLTGKHLKANYSASNGDMGLFNLTLIG